MVYPDVTSGMNINELSLAFNINQQAFHNARLIPCTQKIQLLADVTVISDFIWRFCVNYIVLN